MNGALLRKWFITLGLGTFAPINGDGLVAARLRLIAAPFVADPTIDPTTLVEATFDGYAPGVLPALSGQPTINDPATGDQVYPVPQTDTFNTFLVGGGITAPQTIYGFGITSDSTSFGASNTMVVATFDTPITVTAPGDAVVVPTTNLRVPNGSIHYLGDDN